MFNSLLLTGLGLIGMIYAGIFPETVHTNQTILFAVAYFTGLLLLIKIMEED